MKKLTQKQRKFIENMAKGMSQGGAAVEAGYAPKYACQAAYQALKGIRKRMPEVLDRLGLTDEALIEKQLVPLLEAMETKFFPWRRKRKDGRIEQVIEQRHVAALGTRIAALDMVFKLKGSYAPKQIEIDPDDPVSVTVIDVSAIPKHG